MWVSGKDTFFQPAFDREIKYVGLAYVAVEIGEEEDFVALQY